MAPQVEVVVGPVTLGEGPHWDDAAQALYFVSIFDYTIHKYVPATGKHTSAKLEEMPTFIIPVQDKPDHFVISLKRRVVVVHWTGEGEARVVREVTEVDQENPGNRFNDAKADPRGRLFADHFVISLKRRVVVVHWTGEGEARVVREVTEVDHENPGNRFNDAKADPRGRLFAGTMGNEYEPGKFTVKKGALYTVSPTGRTTKLEGDIDISNGLCWDLKEKAFYYADSFEYAIRRYDYDVETGNISNPRIVFKYAEHGLEGIADGMTIDTDGNLWVANFDGRQVLKIDPRTSTILQKVAIPALQVTSVTFGGPNMDELFVTTASMNRGEEQPPPCGSTFRVTGLGVKGHPNAPVKMLLE